MSTHQIRALPAPSALLGESPLWHPVESSLYWIDIPGKAMHRFHPASGAHRAWNLPAEPGCLAWCADGGMIVALRNGVMHLDTDSGALTKLADAPYDPALMRFNDGRCDAKGRLWAGTLYEPRDRPGGSLFCIERGALRDAAKPVTVSNGLAFSIDASTMYHADTTLHRIVAYDFDLATGTIGDARLLRQFSTDRSTNYGGRPDGAAVDCENAYWCAMFEGGRLLRLSPTGEVLREIVLPVRCPTMVAFGGPDLRTLYVTTARNNRPAEELASHPLSGMVLEIELDVAGCPEPAYIR